MHLYILRHGIAVEGHEWNGSDFTRPLTPEGIRKTEEILKILHQRGEVETLAIFSSPYVRAKQTADIASAELGIPVTVVDELGCGASVVGLTKAFEKRGPLPERAMFVGHEPDSGDNIGMLIGKPLGNYALKKAGIASLTGTFAPGGMTLNWLKAPADVLG